MRRGVARASARHLSVLRRRRSLTLAVDRRRCCHGCRQGPDTSVGHTSLDRTAKADDEACLPSGRGGSVGRVWWRDVLDHGRCIWADLRLTSRRFLSVLGRLRGDVSRIVPRRMAVGVTQ